MLKREDGKMSLSRLIGILMATAMIIFMIFMLVKSDHPKAILEGAAYTLGYILFWGVTFWLIFRPKKIPNKPQ